MALEYTEISSKYNRKRPRVLTIEDLAARKSKRKHKKRHSVSREKAQFKARKKKQMEHYLGQKEKLLKRFHELVRAYWKNELENYPTKPTLPPKPRNTLPAKTRTIWK